MNGHIIHDAKIAVDFWQIKTLSADYTHFLTHLHGDHIVGLTSSWNKLIYCSQFTGNLLTEHYGIKSELIVETVVGQSIIVQRNKFNPFTVTALDADHCPGSVMFFFEGDFGNILYTGDFRASPQVLDACAHLTDKVDILYMDNTYSSPKFMFPSREECTENIIDIVKRHPGKQRASFFCIQI